MQHTAAARQSGNEEQQSKAVMMLLLGCSMQVLRRLVPDGKLCRSLTGAALASTSRAIAS